MERDLLLAVIYEQQEIRLPANFVPRFQHDLLADNQIIVLSGVRRCGKSTLLQEIRSKLKGNSYYLNFDDDRLIHFKVDDFQLLYELFMELFGEQHTFFFDEIQNIPGWERFVRRLHENGNKVFVTGSNASMLSRELGTHLTGRYYQIELFPFSFREFLQFNGKTPEKEDLFTTIGKAKMRQFFMEYFQKGGFPAYLQAENHQYLKSLYESILYRDIIVRNKLTSEKELLELNYFLASNVSRPASFNSLSKIAGVKNASTIKNYIEFIANTYLLFSISKFDFSLKTQIQNPKKFYFIDLALIKEIGFLNSKDEGRLLENLVFLHLRRTYEHIYYHKGVQECDFLIREKGKITGAIQVCWSMGQEETRKREINGLLGAMTAYHLDQGLIITFDEDEILTTEKGQIIIKTRLEMVARRF